MSSEDRRSKQIIKQMIKFQNDYDRRNKEEKENFEATFRKRFALIPTKTTAGNWTWLSIIYVRYEAKKKSFLTTTPAGGLQVTDMSKHYLRHEYEYGKTLEIRTAKEHFLLSLKNAS